MKDPNEGCPMCLVMDMSYEDGETRPPAFKRGYSPVVSAKKNRRHPWEYDKDLYKHRNEAERMFRRLKGFRRIGAMRDKLDLMVSAFIYLALCVIAVCSLIPRSVDTP
jgi:hypothetical protein